MKNIIKKALCIIMAAILLCAPVAVCAENVDEAWDIGENYVYYGTYLSMGSAEYEMSALYEYTLFGFMPDETGKYVFSVDDGAIGIVSYNGMWISIEPSADTVAETSVSWECTGVGQEIWVAVTTDTDFVNVTVTAEESEIVVIEKIPYVNKVTPQEFTYSGLGADLIAVNTRNATVDHAVLGEDGYYHLNSADGYILYANLSDTVMSLYTASTYGQLKGSVYDENGDLVSITDYNEAFAEYYNCAYTTETEEVIYPLTEDLIEMFKEIGANMGWYGEDGWVGGTRDDAWMFACYYTDKVYFTVGDVNNDGQINGKDSNSLMRIVGGKMSVAVGSAEYFASDLNGDGTINAIDTNMLKRRLAGQ